jgi:hypothetical protein
MGPTNIKWVQSYLSAKCVGFVLFYKVRPVTFNIIAPSIFKGEFLRGIYLYYCMKKIVKNHEKYIKKI